MQRITRSLHVRHCEEMRTSTTMVRHRNQCDPHKRPMSSISECSSSSSSMNCIKFCLNNRTTWLTLTSNASKLWLLVSILALQILIVRGATDNNQVSASTQPRPVRADVFGPEDNYNVTVSNSCERQFMRVDIKSTKPLYGVIHTRDQRRKSACTIEGNGDTHYTLDINHVLASSDPLYCGVTPYKESREAKEQLNVVVVVRVHRNIELSDDRFFLLTCPNRCARPDCGRSNRLGELNAPANTRNNNSRLTDDPSNSNATNIDNNECTVWKFPWLITLCWCLAIIALSLLIVNCFLCSTLSCRSTKTEVEERAPSVYEDEEGIVYEPYKITYDSPTAAKLGTHQVPLEHSGYHDDRSWRRNTSEGGNRRHRRGAKNNTSDDDGSRRRQWRS